MSIFSDDVDCRFFSIFLDDFDFDFDFFNNRDFDFDFFPSFLWNAQMPQIRPSSVTIPTMWSSGNGYYLTQAEGSKRSVELK